MCCSRASTPQGLVARFDGGFGAVNNIAFHADVRDAARAILTPGCPARTGRASISRPGSAPARAFVAPYPASLLKMMVAVGIGRLVDGGRSDWTLPLGTCRRKTRPVGDWLFDMITVSSNEATSALVAHLHARGAIRREERRRGAQRDARPVRRREAAGADDRQHPARRRLGQWRRLGRRPDPDDGLGCTAADVAAGCRCAFRSPRWSAPPAAPSSAARWTRRSCITTSTASRCAPCPVG